MASEGKLDEAIRFLAARPPTGRTVTYRALLEKQAAALKAAGRTAAELAPRGEAPAHRMLVWLRPEMVTVAVKPSLMQSRSIPRPPLPGAVECEMRLAGAPAQIDAYETFLMLILCDPGPSHMATVLKRNGGMIVSQGLSIAHPPESPSGLFRWHAIRFEQDPNVMRLYIDGKLRRAWYGQVKPGTQDMTLRMRACTGECRNVRYYVPAPAAFDSTRVEKLLGQFADATLNADPARARQAHAELLSLWQASPHAAPAAERLSARLKLLADALSPKGADLLGPDLRKLWFVHRGSARITDKGIIAWASDRWDTSCAVDLPFAAKAFELSGLLDLRRIGGLVMGLHWNAHDCCPTNYLRIHMPERKAFFGDVKARGAAAALPPTNVPFGFCLRVRGPDAVLFVGDGGKPAIRMSAARIEGNKLLFSWILPYTRMRVDVPRLKLRYLAPDKALDAPAELPKPP